MEVPRMSQDQNTSPSGRVEMPISVLLWIAACSWLNICGWILSSMGQLNNAGYLVSLAGLAAICIWLLRSHAPRWTKVLPRLRWRARRFLPFCYFLLAALAIFAGIIHAPNNYDALAYRLPRILNWLAEGQWHWIHTIFHRLNTRACGIEWVSAPLILFTGSDRLLFLPNAISFLLFPGLTFSILTRLRVSRRVAWQWMWILPTGYCYLLQAGGIANDLFGTVLALCAIDFALRARETNSPLLVWFSILAAAVMTAGKTNNVTLGLAWIAVLAIPLWRTLLLRPVVTLAITLAASLASFLPTAVLNQIYCGDWSGAVAENLGPLTSGQPVLRIGNNLILTVLQNVAPPIFPFAQQWNDFAPRLIPDSIEERLIGIFENSGARWQLPELQMEESASVGLGITLLLLAGIIGSLFSSGKKPVAARLAIPRQLAAAFVVLATIGYLAYCAKSGFGAVGRYFGLYFPFMLPAVLWLPGFRSMLDSAVWKGLLVLCMVLAGLLIVVTPARPLWPAETIIDAAKQNPSLAHSRWVARADAVYATYSTRSDAFAPLLCTLPPGQQVGVVTFDDPETSLWKPFGSRIIKHVIPGESAESLRARGIRVLAISNDRLTEHSNIDLDTWSHQLQARKIATVNLQLRAKQGLTTWTVLELAP